MKVSTRVILLSSILALILFGFNARTIAAEWHKEYLPISSPGLYGVWGSSGSDVFAVGTMDNHMGIILHYDGSSWSTTIVSSITESPLAIWGSSGTDVFAVGNGGMILHYDGSGWSAMSSGTTNVLHGVWGSSATDVFAVGEFGTILHYDGSGWSAMSSGTTNYIFHVWGSSGTDVFAVGEKGTILHYNGSTWSFMTNPFSGSTEYIRGVWGSSGTDVFAVGTGGTILHYDGSSWSARFILYTPLTFLGVWGSSGTDVFAVGNIILHYAANNDDVQDARIAALEAQLAAVTQALQNCGCMEPTNINLSSLKALSSNKKVALKWQTETEPDNAGFNVWRAEGFRKINESIIPALGSPTEGSEYDFVDQWVLNGKRYFYLLEDIDTDGISTFHGPVKAVPRWWYGVGR